MPVPGGMSDLSQVPGSNSPAGSEAIGNSLDNYLRAQAAILKSTNSLASATIAASSTVNVAGADAEVVQITGSATITSLGTGFAGCRRELRFTGVCTFVHSASLALPGAANVAVTSDSVVTFRCLGSNVWALTSASETQPGALPANLKLWNAITPASKQDALGFTPVQQGGGAGQTGNKLYLGWSAANKLKIQVDGLDQGNLAGEGWVTGLLTAKANVSGQAFTGTVTAPTFGSGGATGGFIAGDRVSGPDWTAFASSGFYRVQVGGVDQIAVDQTGGILRKDANSGNLRLQPRIFVGADPGAAAADNDLWFS